MLRPRQLLSLVAGFTVMLVQGSLYIFGTITPYIATYLYYKGDRSVSVSDLSIILTLALIFTNVGIFACNFKWLAFSNRVTSLVTSLGISLSTLALSYCSELYQYVVLYGMVYGFFIGFGYMAPLKNCYDHLPDRKGLCSGTCLMGFGLGALFFNFIVVALVNPDNETQTNRLFPESVGDNLPGALRIMGIIYAAIGIVGALLIWPPQAKDVVQQPLIPEQKDELEPEGHCSRKALKIAYDNNIFFLTLILATGTPYGIFVAFSYKQYGLLSIKDDYYLSIVGSVGSVANGLFRMFWGVMMDCFPFRTNIFAMLSVFAVSCLTIVWSVQSKVSYLFTVFLTYCCYGGLYSVFPTQTVRILGRATGPKLYYFTFFGFCLGALIQYFGHKLLVDSFGKQGYLYCFMIFGGLLLVSFVLVWRVRFVVRESEAVRGQGQVSVIESEK